MSYVSSSWMVELGRKSRKMKQNIFRIETKYIQNSAYHSHINPYYPCFPNYRNPYYMDYIDKLKERSAFNWLFLWCLKKTTHLHILPIEGLHVTSLRIHPLSGRSCIYCWNFIIIHNAESHLVKEHGDTPGGRDGGEADGKSLIIWLKSDVYTCIST